MLCHLLTSHSRSIPQHLSHRPASLLCSFEFLPPENSPALPFLTLMWLLGFLIKVTLSGSFFFKFQLFSDLCCLRGILTPRQAGLLVGVTQRLSFGVKKIKNVPWALISPTNQCCCWCRPRIPSLAIFSPCFAFDILASPGLCLDFTVLHLCMTAVKFRKACPIQSWDKLISSQAVLGKRRSSGITLNFHNVPV